MARIRHHNEIISSLLDFFRIAQPSLDTKPGTVSRDLLVEGPSAQIARLYDEINRVSTLQSLRLALGIDLDRLGDNFGIKRNRGTTSTGPALLTTNNLDADIAVNKGDIIIAKNGAAFSVVNSTVVSVVLSNQYKSTAAKFRSDLDFLGITDKFAIEVLVRATSTGIQGNISKYSLSRTSISGINNVTNVVAIGGGNGVEDDTAFRNRILAVFSGANTGTALGYRNAVTADNSVIDAIVIEPGDSLMTRDGTQVNVSTNGTRTVISEGTGGKVDVYIFGVRIQEALDSFIYRDLSNTGDPTNPKNDFVLGQITEDFGKTVTRKRLDNIANQVLPNQPVNNIIEISSSNSGANYLEKSVDSLGRVTGNFELIRDVGAFGGSPWGFDKIHWINDRIEDFAEDKTKQIFNGQDSVGFTDVLEISRITQNISIVNENSNVSPSDRTLIQLAHFPITNVTRVFNVTTGERYIITNQNPNGNNGDTINLTGKINISGRSLPAISDTLQVDYTWVFSYDPYFDFDNRLTNNNPRTVRDSVDWGLSNAVRREKSTLMATGSFLTTTVTHPISSVISVNVFSNSSGIVTLSSGRLAIVVDLTITNVISVSRISDGAELWNTNKSNGTFSGQTIFFPTDSVVALGDVVNVIYNPIDVFNASTAGSFNGNSITIVPSATAVSGLLVECNYIANVNIMLPATLLPALPAIRSGNAFSVNGINNIGCQPTTHIFSNSKVISNLRQAPSNLILTIAGSISPGIITVTGSTITKATDIVFTVSTAGLKQDLSAALKKALNLNSKSSIPNTIRLTRIVKVSKVTTNSNFDVLSNDYNYDIKGYHLFDNTFVKNECVTDETLKLTEFILPATSSNTSNIPVPGNRLQVTFYYTTNFDSENVSFSKSGTLYTNKKFALIDTVAISSGFTSGGSSASTLSIYNLNQPVTKSRYKVNYDYLAPKVNERINIRFNFDKLIGDSTFAIEKTRPITADILVKSSVPILVDVDMRITVTDEFKTSSTIVLQNVQDAVTLALNATALNTKIDSSDLVNQAYTVTGVDSARVIFFNKSEKSGSVLSITAGKNEFIRANTVTIKLDNG
jgi:hypothetical protein